MENNEALNTLNDIKDLMEKSSRFQSISGLSIILIGLYATLVSVGAWLLWGNHGPISWLPDCCSNISINSPLRTKIAILFAILLLIISFSTVCLLSYRKTKRQNGTFSFNATVRRPLLHFSIPMLTGGLFCLAMLLQQHYGLTSSIMLIFYGLALINCHHYTNSSIAILGYGQLLLGIIDCFLVRYAILFWFLGFGLWHIIFGLYFTLKYGEK
mgnify:CR=1 FL=1